MKGLCGVFLLLCVAVASADVLYLSAANGLAVEVDTSKGTYSLSVDGTTWFNGGATALHSANTWFKSGDNLQLRGGSSGNCNDAVFGPCKVVTLNWLAGSISFETSVTVFSDHEIVLFGQAFPNGVDAPAVPNNNKTVVAAFPTFPTTGAAPLSFYTYHDTFAKPVVGKWANPSNFPGGVDGGSPLILYNSKKRTLVFSPRENFMTGVQVISKDLDNYLSFGLNGKITKIPAGFTHTTILVGGQGIGSTIQAWGDALLKSYGKKERTKLNADILIRSLGYWTDNGAFYYYTTEPGKNYADTMVDVKKYITSIGVPVTNYQFDSWWYFKGANGGVTVWEPMPSIFPNGMEPVTAQLAAPVSLHNRWFAPDSPYLKNFTFIVESYACLPAEQAVFDYIMGKAHSWGMVLYEQDWLVTTYMDMVATQNNVTNSRNWLKYMNDAAAKLDVTIQYCMALPNHLMQSVELPAVTQSRASDDYQPSNSQWQMFHTAQLIWAVGLVPYKDDFWTTSNQTGCRYSLCIEYTPVLETLVAALSAGPVGPADKIGAMNKDLVMRTCAANGDLLKADLPALPLDSTLLPPTPDGTPSLIQVAASYTAWGPFRWYYLLGANLKSVFTVTPEDLPVGSEAKYFDYFKFLNTPTAANVATFNNSNPIKIPAASVVHDYELGAAAGPVGFNYYVVAPVLQSGWVLLGETSKFITVSKQRITAITSNPTELLLTIVGTPKETITLSLINTQSVQQAVQQFTITVATSPIVFTCAAGPNGVCKYSS